MANDRDPLFEDEQPGMLARLLPPLVLISAFGGFIALAIYAYQAGTQSVGDGELAVVEADKTPMKEKPEDPGGMQFPNQDKTIFETFAGGKQPAKVERVLPTPEEPMTPSAGENAAATPAAAPAGIEQVFSEKDAPATAPEPEVKSAPKVVNVQEELGKQAVAETTATPAAAPAPVVVSAAPVAVAPEPVKPEVPAAKAVELQQKAVAKSVEKTKVEAAKVIEKAKVADKPKPTTGKAVVQLGAYKSEAEAKTDFAKMQKKFASLSGKTPTINRADLGDKGVFYRLRVATDDAKKLCASLSGQACMVVK